MQPEAANEAVLVDALVRELAHIGMSWHDLCRTSEQIVLFGSRAIGAHAPASDWDVLRVADLATDFERKQECKIDLVQVSTRYLTSEKWLASELASHVAAYGKWLHGHDNWSRAVRRDQRAYREKLSTLRREIATLALVWERIAPQFRARRAHRLRLQIQRLHRLKTGMPVPPTCVLDSEWLSGKRASLNADEADILGVEKIPGGRSMLEHAYLT